MAENKSLMILERSSQNLQKITKNGKTMLEGVFAEFGVENRNGRVYEEKEYLPHLEYLKKDITNGNLLGELDHPERFEVALSGVSHRIAELWYDQQKRQVLGRLEILEGTPKGQIAKALLEAGVPLSISSRAAGTVNEDKTVAIQQIYTYDLVAKPGFESATLKQVNESVNPRQIEINRMIKELNESSVSRHDHSITSTFGILNENISIIDVTDKFPSVPLREEAKQLIKNNNLTKMAETKPEVLDETAVQQWTVYFKNELSAIKDDLNKLNESAGETGKLQKLEEYVEKIRKIQEDSLNWSSEIAKAVNEVATYADTLAEKSNNHYKLTKKIATTVDHNAKTLNATQDWTSEIAKVTNAIGETVDHNAGMLNGLNEWSTQIAKGVNSLNEWGEEKAKAINGMHEWTSSIAKNLNHSVNWTEDMFGRAISKEDATKILEYVELVSESKSNPELKSKIDEMLKTHSITAKPLNEANLKGIAVIDSVGKVGNVKVDDLSSKNSGVAFDAKTRTIQAKTKAVKVGAGKLPVGNDKLQMNPHKSGGSLPKDGGCCNDPKDLKAGLKVTKSIKVDKNGGTTKIPWKTQNLKLNQKAGGKSFANENLNKFIITESLLTQEQFSEFIDGLVALNDPQLAAKMLSDLFDSNPQMHELTGDIRGKEDYKEGLDKFRAKYGRANENLNKSSDIQTRKLNLEDKLSKIVNALEKEKSLDEEVKSQFPFTQLLSEEDRKRFNGLDTTDKQKVVTELEKNPTTDSKVIVKLWENAVATKRVEEPLWLTLAPKAYKDAFDSAPESVKENIKAKSEFFTLNTAYQIENFWEQSGVILKPSLTLNESVYAKTPEESEQKLDTFVAQVGEYMKNRYVQS
jgi:hypothetical protein